MSNAQTLNSARPDAAAAQLHAAQLALLRRQWLVVAAAYAAGLLLGWLGMRTLGASAWAWLVPAAALLVIQLGVLWWALPANHPPDNSALWPALGVANWMTLTRGLLVGLLAGFIFAPLPAGAWAWLPALLYTSERLLDFMDGYVARITRRESRLGAILDMEFDGLGILIASAVAIQMGKLPAWYLLLGVARPLFVLGIFLRRRRHLPVHELPPSSNRRLVAGVQTAFVSVMLWPPLPPELTHLAAVIFALPLIASFGRDWLVVSGWVDVSSRAYTRTHAAATWLVEGVLPVGARVIGAAAALWIVWVNGLLPDAMDVAASAPRNETLWTAVAFVAVAAALFFLLGAAARVAALLLLCLVLLDATATGLDLASALLLMCAAFVLHVGPGRPALWQPEERIFHTALGAQAQPAAGEPNA